MKQHPAFSTFVVLFILSLLPFITARSGSGLPQNQDMARIPAGTLVIARQKIQVGSFYIDRYEVTQQQYEKVTGDNLSFFKGPQRPVENVNWHEADAYCRKIGKRLPTEAEWELAAHAGAATAYYWGDAIDDAYAWYKKNSDKQTHPVGGKKPNAYGLYDMAGNVWEWTASDHENGGKVQRGESWRNGAFSQRLSHRILSNPVYRYHYVGFRCARSKVSD